MTVAGGASSDIHKPFIPPSVVPDERANTLFRFIRAMISNPVSAMPADAYREPVTTLSIAGERIAFISDPAILEEILIRRYADFPKTHVDERLLKPALGDGLITAHGEAWRWKRRLAAPYFSPSALANYLPGMVAPFEALSRTWRQEPGLVDISSGMARATAEVINDILLGDSNALDLGELLQAMADYLTPISWVVGMAMLKMPRWAPHPHKRKIGKARDKLRKLAGDLVKSRHLDPRDDFCARLMAASDPETGNKLTDRDMVDMLLTLVAAGHETSANTLAWACLCLASQQEMQNRLRKEVREVVGERAIDAQDLPKLRLIEAFLQETMRLFPAVPIIARQNIKPESIGGERFAPGSILFIPPYVIHRHHLLWDRPERFDIERFMGAEAKKIGRTVYMPFGAGPRICLGGAFAMMEMVAAVATLLRHLQFETPERFECEPIHRITLRPRHDLKLIVQPL